MPCHLSLNDSNCIWKNCIVPYAFTIPQKGFILFFFRKLGWDQINLMLLPLELPRFICVEVFIEVIIQLARPHSWGYGLPGVLTERLGCSLGHLLCAVSYTLTFVPCWTIDNSARLLVGILLRFLASCFVYLKILTICEACLASSLSLLSW